MKKIVREYLKIGKIDKNEIVSSQTRKEILEYKVMGEQRIVWYFNGIE